MKRLATILVFLITAITGFGYDFIYEPNHLTRNSDPFYIQNRVMRFEDSIVDVDTNTGLFFREYSGKKYFCTDNSINEAGGDLYCYLLSDSTNSYVVETTDSVKTFNDTIIARIKKSEATIINTNELIVVEKPDWVYVAQGVYTNGLATLQMNGVWTNMDYTFESVGANILQTMGAAMAAGNMEQVNLINIWKGLIKDSYETLYRYGSKYGIEDMRLFPYEQSYIVSNTITKVYMEYGTNKYYIEGK